MYIPRIVQVCGTSLLGATHAEAVRALRSVGDKRIIMICDGYDPSLVEETGSPTSPMSDSSRHDSISSIDREDEDTDLIQKVLYQFNTKGSQMVGFVTKNVHFCK